MKIMQRLERVQKILLYSPFMHFMVKKLRLKLGLKTRIFISEFGRYTGLTLPGGARTRGRYFYRLAHFPGR